MTTEENEKQAIHLLEDLLKNQTFNKGELNRPVKGLVDVAIALNKLKLYPGIVDTDVILISLSDELRKFHKIYEGSIQDNDVAPLAHKIHKILKSFPATYKFLFEMPSELKIKKELRIDKGIRLFRATEDDCRKIDEKNKFTYLRHKNQLGMLLQQLAGQGTVKEPAVPQYANIEKGRVYLEIDAQGFAGDSYAATTDVDPIHIFKLLIAYLELNKVLLHSSLYHIFGRNPYERQRNNVIVYKSNMEYVTDLARPLDEANYVKTLDFSKETKVNDIKTLIQIFKKLLSPMTNEYLEEERNKIVNSLFWYFEGQKSETPAFKTLMNTAMFDSFFDSGDSKERKARSIVSVISTDPDDPTVYTKIVTMYSKRNDIAHGKIQLMEVDHKTKKQRDSSLDSVIRNIYQSYILVKISKLLS